MSQPRVTPSPSDPAILLLTPDLHGADGVSCVARQLARAVHAASSGPPPEIWVYADEARHDLVEAEVPGTVRSAAGRRGRLVRWALVRATSRCRRLLVIVAHARLAPLALPLVARGARLAIYLHGIEVWRPLSPLETATFRRAAVLLANSRHTVDGFRMANPALAGAAIAICPPGVSPIGTSGSRRTSSVPTVLTVGRLWAEERYKGHDQLFDIWPAVRQAVPAARLVIVGDGDDRPRLERRAAAEGLGGSVEFLGRVPRARLEQAYRECDLFAMPSAREGFGLVFLEAMSAGKPCIGGTGGASEIIVDGDTGFVVDPADREALRAALLRLLGDRDLRERMGSAGARRVAECFTQAHAMRRMAGALGGLVSSGADVEAGKGDGEAARIGGCQGEER
ncbi:MAG: glycosyltransferase family 4 protein [Acidobacteriota bacterium]|nr:glycosyltransferase family 4 protein [Acidobacteriota bacterium]